MQSALEQAIRALATFLPQGKQMPIAAFDQAVCQRLQEIETLSRKHLGLRDMYRKLCFDLCAYELDGSFILRRLRYKPLGQGGDFEALDKLYLGTGTTFWDAFLQYQQSVKFFQEFQIISSASPILFLSPVYRVLQNSQADISIVDYESQRIHFAKSFARLDVYGNLDEINKQFGLIYAPYLLHRVRPESLAEMIKYLWQKLEPSGCLALYQLSATHHLRWFMEWCLDWVLYYHHEKTLKKLANTLKAELKLEVVGEWSRLEFRKLS
jgi:hypothetical protein